MIYVFAIENMTQGVCGSCYRSDYVGRNHYGKQGARCAIPEKECRNCIVEEINAHCSKHGSMTLAPDVNVMFAAPGDKHNEIFLFQQVSDSLLKRIAKTQQSYGLKTGSGVVSAFYSGGSRWWKKNERRMQQSGRLRG